MKGHTISMSNHASPISFSTYFGKGGVLYHEMTLLCDLSLHFATTTMLCCKCGPRIIIRTKMEVRTVQDRMSSAMETDVLLPVDENQREQYFSVITIITIVITTTRVLFFLISAQPSFTISLHAVFCSRETFHQPPMSSGFILPHFCQNFIPLLHLDQNPFPLWTSP